MGKKGAQEGRQQRNQQTTLLQDEGRPTALCSVEGIEENENVPATETLETLRIIGQHDSLSITALTERRKCKSRHQCQQKATEHNVLFRRTKQGDYLAVGWPRLEKGTRNKRLLACATYSFVVIRSVHSRPVVSSVRVMGKQTLDVALVSSYTFALSLIS